MHLECHAMLGWAIGNVGSSNPQLRRYCTVAAVLPDIDALPYVLGPRYYELYHHTFGHNLLLWFLFSAYATYKLRSWKGGILTFVAFGSHLITDAYFSGWPLYLYWPFSRQGFMVDGAVSLSHPINIHLMYVGFIVVILLAACRKRTPIELFSPRLDQLLISALARREKICGRCQRKANQQCATCGAPVCWRHASVTRSYEVFCPHCFPAKVKTA